MKINGELYDYQSMSVTNILENLSIKSETVVVEVNGEIVPKVNFSDFIVDKAAVVELVAFVGGG